MSRDLGDFGRKAFHVVDVLVLGFGAYLLIDGRIEAGTVVLVSALVWAFGRTLNLRLAARLPATWRGDVIHALTFTVCFAVVITGFDVILFTLGWSELGSRPLRDLLSSLAFFLVVLTPLTAWLRIRKRRRDQSEARRRRAGPGLLTAEPGQRKPPPGGQSL